MTTTTADRTFTSSTIASDGELQSSARRWILATLANDWADYVEHGDQLNRYRIADDCADALDIRLPGWLLAMVDAMVDAIPGQCQS